MFAGPLKIFTLNLNIDRPHPDGDRLVRAVKRNSEISYELSVRIAMPTEMKSSRIRSGSPIGRRRAVSVQDVKLVLHGAGFFGPTYNSRACFAGIGTAIPGLSGVIHPRTVLVSQS